MEANPGKTIAQGIADMKGRQTCRTTGRPAGSVENSLPLALLVVVLTGNAGNPSCIVLNFSTESVRGV